MEYKKLFEELIETLISEDGSDLHLSAGRFPAVRVNGELIFLMTRPEMTQTDLEGIIKTVISPENYAHFIEAKDLDFSTLDDPTLQHLFKEFRNVWTTVIPKHEDTHPEVFSFAFMCNQNLNVANYIEQL